MIKSWNFLFLVFFLFCTFSLSASVYRIDLNWDEMNGECAGFVNGTIGKDTGFVNGNSSQSVLNGQLQSVGEGKSSTAKQSFLINAEDGFFTFWIRDKFTDQDMNPDPTLIAQSKPQVFVYKDNQLLQQFNITKGDGLTCKVFTLDSETGEVEKEIRFFPACRIIVGKAIDAVTGKALVGATVSLTGDEQQSTPQITDETGMFFFEVPTGKFTVYLQKQGYISLNYKMDMGFDENPRELNAALSPEIKEFRIVVTWGSRPQDLDAHLSGPKPEGGNFHIWYRNRYPVGGRDFLDRDCQSGYGPETITVYKPALGEYYYSIFDYSNKTSKRNKKLSRSNATVQVYGQNKLLATFEVPANQKGNCWHVFKIDREHTIIPINKIDFVEDEKLIQ